MINKQLDKQVNEKTDYKYDLKYRSVIRSNMDDVIEVQEKGIKYGFIPAFITGFYLYKKKYSNMKTIMGFFGSQFLFFSIYSYGTYRLYESVSYKVNSRISEDVNSMMDLK